MSTAVIQSRDTGHNVDFNNLLANDIRQRLAVGQGETLFTIGDDSWKKHLDTAIQYQNALMTSSATSSASNSSGSVTSNHPEDINEGFVYVSQLASELHLSVQELRRTETQIDLLLRRQQDDNEFIEIRVAVIGNVDAGKSTLLGVLTHSEMDNGRGHARQKLFRHRHELESGRTSAVSSEILGFDNNGSVVNKASHSSQSHPLSAAALNTLWQRVCQQASKIITFVDLAGHEKYLKTTVFGMTGHLPDFCMLIVGSNQGVVGMAKEHLGLALALSVPVFVVVTKVDMCPKNVLDQTMKTLRKILKSPACRKMPLDIQDDNDVVMAAHNFSTERICPIFQVSNVTGLNLNLLKKFLNLLTSRSTSLKNTSKHGTSNLLNSHTQSSSIDTSKDTDENKIEVLLDDSFAVAGVGTVVSGTVLSGLLKQNSHLMFGPNALGKFVDCHVRTLQRRRLPVEHAGAGQTVAAAIRPIKRSAVRKGQVLISKSALEGYKLTNKETGKDVFAVWEFLAEVLILHHPTTISVRYQAMIHIGSIRQTGVIKWMDMERLKTGDRAKVKFCFLKHPELVRPGQKFVFREGRTKAVGTVLECLATVKESKETTISGVRKVGHVPVVRSTGQGSERKTKREH